MPTPREYLEGFVNQARSRLNGLMIGTEISVKSLIDLQASMKKRQRDAFPNDASVSSSFFVPPGEYDASEVVRDTGKNPRILVC
jgi:hypothetical protein